MAKRITIKEMVKDIFFDATKGIRTVDNYMDGQIVLNSLQSFYYRFYFERIYKEWQDGTSSARSLLHHIYLDLRQRGAFNDHAREVADALRTFILA